MSRTGKKSISIPDKVKVNLKGNVIATEGPLGKEEVTVHPMTDVIIEGKTIQVTRKNDSPEVRSLHGLMRALIDNAVNGVAVGFKRNLEINGVGYRAEVKGEILKLTLGFSHIVDFGIPKGIKIAVTDQTKLSISGSNKETVGRVAAEIRKFRPPEPYKGKGIKYSDETIIRKVGKAAGGK